MNKMISNKLLFLFFGSHIALNLDKAIDRGMFRRVTGEITGLKKTQRF